MWLYVLQMYVVNTCLVKTGPDENAILRGEKQRWDVVGKAGLPALTQKFESVQLDRELCLHWTSPGHPRKVIQYARPVDYDIAGDWNQLVRTPRGESALPTGSRRLGQIRLETRNYFGFALPGNCKRYH